MSEIKVNSIKGVGASSAAITVNNTDGTCTANITNNLSNRNLIINGAMQVAQRGTSSTSDGYQTVDRFKLRAQNTDQWAFTQTVEDVAVNEPPFYTDGFRKYYDIQTTTIETSLEADEYVDIFQRVEANNTVHLGYGQSGGTAKTLTLSFWVRAYQTGTYVFYLYLYGGKMQTKAYTINASNTWEKKTIKIEPDGADAQLPSTAYSLQCGWLLGAGSNYTSGSNSTSYIAYANANFAAGQTGQITASTNNYFHLTGVQLEVNSTGVARDYDHMSFAQELQLCNRYYYDHLGPSPETDFAFAVGSKYNSNLNFCVVNFPVQMRAVPTLESSTTTDSFYKIINGGVDNYADHAMSKGGRTGARIYPNNGNDDVGSSGQSVVLHANNTSACQLRFNAEL